MIKLIKILFIISAIAVSNNLIAQKAQKELDVKTVKLQTSAHTDNCKAKIEKTLAYEKGIIESELNQESQILTVKYNSKKSDVKKIIKVIEGLGHEATEIADEENNIKKE